MRTMTAAAVFLLALFAGCCGVRERDTLFQASLINALLEGVFDGETTFGELARRGDFGIGTFDALDGEMVGLDGEFYRVRADFTASRVGDAEKTPFAAVTFFDADGAAHLEGVEDLDGLKARLDTMIGPSNFFHAIKVTGRFSYVKTRSAPRQERPYPPLAKALEHQPEKEFHDVEGTLVGFRCPEFADKVNVPGYHLHFITKDRTSGGHLLACVLERGVAETDVTTSFFMRLPRGDAFRRAAVGGDRREELDRAESDRE